MLTCTRTTTTARRRNLSANTRSLRRLSTLRCLPPQDPSSPPPSPPSPYPKREDSRQTHTWSELLDFEGINHVLWEAAGENDGPLLRQALSDGAQVNAGNPGDFYCWTALHKGAYSGAVEAVGELLAAGADIEARDTWNKTALLLAAEMGALQCEEM